VAKLLLNSPRHAFILTVILNIMIALALVRYHAYFILFDLSAMCYVYVESLYSFYTLMTNISRVCWLLIISFLFEYSVEKLFDIRIVTYVFLFFTRQFNRCSERSKRQHIFIYIEMYEIISYDIKHEHE